MGFEYGSTSKSPLPSQDEAEHIAVQGLAFLASDDERMTRFLALTGLEAQDLRAAARSPAFLVGVVEHLLGDETLLMVFAEAQNIDPVQIGHAHARLTS